MASCTSSAFLQLGEVGAHVEVADELALVGDRVDEVQRGQAIEAVLVRAALDGLLLPLPGWAWARRLARINMVLLPA